MNTEQAAIYLTGRNGPPCCVLFLKSLQGKGVEMGHHSGGNIHALRLTTGWVCVCVSTVGQAGGVCVAQLQAALAQSLSFVRLKEANFQDEYVKA